MNTQSADDIRATMRLLITGGRAYTDWVRVQRILDPYLTVYGPELIIIEGGALGADALVRKWAESRGVQVATVKALWDFWGSQGNAKVAGPRRNEAMLLLQPDEVIAFPGGDGTAHMVKTARKAGIKVVEYK